MQENQNENNKNFIIPEWKRSKDAVIDSYLLTINSMAEVLPKFYIRNQRQESMIDAWRKGVISLFFQIKEHEKTLNDIALEDIKNKINTISELLKFTNLVLNTKTLKDIKAISKKKDYDPVIQYTAEAYK